MPCPVAPNHFEISPQDLENTKMLYAAQLKTLFDVNMKSDESIIRLLAVGRNLNTPYLLYLADIYIRELLKAGEGGLTVAKFVTDKRHKHFAELGKHAEMVQAAVTSFYKRIMPAITLKPPRVFSACVEATGTHIVSAATFVKTLASGSLGATELTTPFQFDLSFAFKDAKESGDEEKVEFEFKDVFGDIECKLADEQLPFDQTKLQVKSVDDEELGRHFGCALFGACLYVLTGHICVTQ